MSPKKKVQNVPGLAGTQTEKNLMAAFAGESQARNKYDYFASIADKEGYKQIAAIFRETALNEHVHAKLFYQAAANFGSTLENLLAAAAGEHEEWADMYKGFAAKAQEEGFLDVADLFTEIATVEAAHEARYRALAARMENGTLFKQDKPVKWHCRNCGYIYTGTEAPDVCPGCQHPQGWFELACE